MEVIRFDKADISKLDYHKPVNQKNIYCSAINYDKIPCYIQTSKLTFIELKEDKSTKQTYMVASVDPSDFSFYDFLVKLDDHNLSVTYLSSKEWFNKELPMDVLEGMYRRITKPFKKDEIPIIELKVPIIKQQIQCSLYDQSNSSIPVNSLIKGSKVIGIFHMKGLKFLKKDYYCDIYISQIKLCQDIPYSIPGTCLIIDDPTENTTYDYEILDEEVINNHKLRLDLEEQYKALQEKHEIEKKSLLDLRKRIDNLN